ncbi:MAG TPA: permease-like cell division protein FtsX [Bacillota bacterium]
MSIRTWAFLCGQALKGLRRNAFMTLAAISTVAVCLTVLAAVLLVAVNLQYMASFVESQVEVVAYVRPDFDRMWRDLLLRKIQAIPGVREAHFVTREESLERLKEQFGEHAYLLEGLDDPTANPLRDAVEIGLTSPQHAAAVTQAVERIESVEEVSHRQDIVDKLLAVTRVIRAAGLGIVGLLALATVFIIANTIRLTVYARRREIGIMKLVGATDGLIRWPFFLEGLILGVGGAMIAAAAAWVGYDRLVETLTTALPFVPVLDEQPLVSNLAKLLLILGALIGAMGSSISLRRFLRV